MRNSTRTNLIISVVFHSIIIIAIFVFAAREGILGTKLKTIAVTMIPKTKPPEPPKEKPPEEAPKIEVPKPVQQAAAPKVAQAPPATQGVAPPPSVAPAAAEIPAFDFAGGKAVTSTDDPSVLYKNWIEYSFRSRWMKPDGIKDNNYLAEMWVWIDEKGVVNKFEWQKKSGDDVWDRSIAAAFASVKSLNRPPPKEFPPKILIRFDVQEEEVLSQ